MHAEANRHKSQDKKEISPKSVRFVKSTGSALASDHLETERRIYCLIFSQHMQHGYKQARGARLSKFNPGFREEKIKTHDI